MQSQSYESMLGDYLWRLHLNPEFPFLLHRSRFLHHSRLMWTWSGLKFGHWSTLTWIRMDWNGFECIQVDWSGLKWIEYRRERNTWAVFWKYTLLQQDANTQDTKPWPLAFKTKLLGATAANWNTVKSGSNPEAGNQCEEQLAGWNLYK